MTAYPVVYSHKASSSTGPGTAIDLAGANNPGFPPVMIVTATATGAVVMIEGSHDNSSWVDFSSGGFTVTAAAGIAKDLVPGVRYWRTNVVSVTGTVTSSVGGYPTAEGGFNSPNAPVVSSDATIGQ